MHKQKERFRQCEKLIKKATKEAPPAGVIGCRKCPFYMPEFKYRKCMYATCPYGQER